ncbi:MAG: acyltransferase [Candidatus Thorarchaeota archaeon]|nr:acyltransferase [Candidatus Thorarchaeota archaeon]
MRVAVGQIEPHVSEYKRNLQIIRDVLSEAKDVEIDVLVLPELCNSGYVFESREEVEASAESIPEGQTSRELISWSRDGRFVVAGICERTKEGLHNSAAAFGDGKHFGTYRKIHLFLNERDWFLQGNEEPPVYEHNENRFGVMICFDWAFPEVARILALKQAQIILHPSNLVLPYCQDAMVTRSIENHIFTATANRTGTERGVTFSGSSQITDVNGKRLVRMGLSDSGIGWADVELKLADSKSITARNDSLRDRRPGLYTRLTQDD